MRYTDGEWIYFVGMGPGNTWMTFRSRDAWARQGHRVKSKYLPVRANRQEAQADLGAWAERKHLRLANPCCVAYSLKEE